jgi:glycosyltransferase involved in cell wall biosynthesis
MGLTIAAIVCAYNESRLLSGCLYSLRAQTRPADDILVVNNASTDETGAVAREVPGVRLLDEPCKGLVVARETARLAAHADIVAYIDADCRAPITWLERVEAQFSGGRAPVAVTGPYRFYDWDWSGRALIRAYDVVVAPATHALVHHGLGIGAILYGGNFAVQSEALRRIGGFDRRIEFHGEDTNLGRRLTAVGRVARMATLGRREFSVTEERFNAYLADIAAEAKRARRLYDLLVVPGAEITQNHIRSRKNSHIIALNIKEFISADQPAEDILRAIRAQGALSIACHPHHRTTRRVEVGTCYLWDHRKRMAELVDVWEAANRDDLFSVTSLKHYPYIANSDFHKPKHLHWWKTLVRSEKTWEAVAVALRSNVDVALTLYRNGSWAA